MTDASRIDPPAVRAIPMRVKPVVVMPPVYEIPLNMWRWCKVCEVLTAVQGLSESMGYGLRTIPAALAERFAALVRPNKPRGVEVVDPAQPPKRILRFSVTGRELRGVEVAPRRDEPNLKIVDGSGLDLPSDFGPEVFVPEGWAQDLLRFVRLGLHSATLFQTLEKGKWSESLLGTPYFHWHPEVTVRNGKVLSGSPAYWAWLRSRAR